MTYQVLPDPGGVEEAARYLTRVAVAPDAPPSYDFRRLASAIIRAERKRLVAARNVHCAKRRDFGSSYSDSDLMWIALENIAGFMPEHRCWRLREAEAALRTLHKRGRRA